MRYPVLVVLGIWIALLAPGCQGGSNQKKRPTPSIESVLEHQRILSSRIKSIKEYRCRVDTGPIPQKVAIISEMRYGENGYQTEEYHYDDSGALSYREALKFDQGGMFLESTDYDTNGKSSFRRLYTYDEHANEGRYYSSRRRPEEKTLDQSDQYDGQGNIVHWTSFNSDGTIGSVHDLAYDSLGRLAVEREFESDGSFRGSSTIAYDSAGNKIQELFFDRRDSLKTSYFWKYDRRGRLIEDVNGDTGNRTEYRYDEGGHLLKEIQYGNDLNSDTTTFTYEYERKGNKSKETWFNETTKETERVTVYEYEYFDDY
jgi:YD repeat-containing protein